MLEAQKMKPTLTMDEDACGEDVTSSAITSRKRKRNEIQKKKQDNLNHRQRSQQLQQLSIQALLSVPLKYILRKTSNTKNKTVSNHPPDENSTNSGGKRRKEQLLLSKTEASAFIKLSNLAHEIDMLLYMLSSALHRSHVTKQLSMLISIPHSTFTSNISSNGFNCNDAAVATVAATSLSEATKIPSNKNTSGNNNSNTFPYNYYLRPIQCILNIHGTKIPNQVIQHVQENLERILSVEFPLLYQILIQCAEQNWFFSNALLVPEDDDDDDDEEDGDDGNDGNDSNDESCSDNNSSISNRNSKKRKKNANYVSQLGRDKGILAELEEEVCRRMDGLIQMATGTSVSLPSFDDCDDGCNPDGGADVDIDNIVNTSPDNREGLMSIEKLCQDLFSDSNDNNARSDSLEGATNEKRYDNENDTDGEEQKKSSCVSDSNLLEQQNCIAATNSQKDAAAALGMLSSWGHDI